MQFVMHGKCYDTKDITSLLEHYLIIMFWIVLAVVVLAFLPVILPAVHAQSQPAKPPPPLPPLPPYVDTGNMTNDEIRALQYQARSDISLNATMGAVVMGSIFACMFVAVIYMVYKNAT